MRLTVEEMKNVQVGEKYRISNYLGSGGKPWPFFKQGDICEIVHTYDRDNEDYGFHFQDESGVWHLGLFGGLVVSSGEVLDGTLVMERLED